MLLAVVALVPLMMVFDRSKGGLRTLLSSISRADWARLAGIAVAGMFLFSVLMLYGMKEAPGAVAGIVMATTPAVTAAGSVLFLRDRLNRPTALAIALAVGGVMAVNLGNSGGGGDDILLGTLLVFGAVCGEAAYMLLGKRPHRRPLAVRGRRDRGGTRLAAVRGAGGRSALRLRPRDRRRLGVGRAGLVGIGTMAMGSFLWYFGVQQVSGTTASAFMGVMPVSALLLSYLLLGESFEPIHAVGMVAALGGIAAVTYGEREKGEG